MLKPNRYYEVTDSSTIKCGECWDKDIAKTQLGDYTGEEAVYESQLIMLSDNEPLQCDDCLKQNEAYESVGDEYD